MAAVLCGCENESVCEPETEDQECISALYLITITSDQIMLMFDIREGLVLKFVVRAILVYFECH
jgi:hypothetical protein